MNRRIPFWVMVFSAALIVMTYHHTHRRTPLPPGEFASAEPRIDLTTEKSPWAYKGYTITPLASCWIRARVLSRKPYRWDRGAKLSPLDWAVGWRRMSDSTYLNQLRITQGSRWYFFEYDRPVLSNEIISAESKNIHVIPATAEIAARARAVRKDQIIRANGWLVKMTGPKKYTWVSSISTGGSGEGSCWLYWIERLDVEQNPLLVRLQPVSQ